MADLYNTTGEENIEYLNKGEAVNNEIGTPTSEDPIRNPYNYATSMGNPRKRNYIIPSKGSYVIPEDEWNRYSEGFSGESKEELDKYRIDTQSTSSKAFNTIAGGILQGAGGLISSVGYLMDFNTYRSMFTDIDYNTNKQMGFLDYLPNQMIGQGLQKLGQGITEGINKNMPIYENQGQTIAEQVFNWNAFRGVVESITEFAALGGIVSTGVKALGNVALKELMSAGKFAEAALEAKKISKIPSVISKLAEGAGNMEKAKLVGDYLMNQTGVLGTLARNAGPTISGAFTKLAEARMEGLSAYDESMSNLEPLIQQGALTKEQAIAQANIAANHASEMTMLTVAGDALMLRKLHTPKGKIIANQIMKPGIKSTLKTVGKDLLGAPKEGLEEMWQEAAQMEGMYTIYKNINDKITDKQKKYLKYRMGFDPDKAPEEFWARTVDMLSSTRAQVAGIIGAVSGPFQSALLGTAGSGMNRLKEGKDYKSDKKRQLEDYNKQQAEYKNNESLFKAANGFADVVIATANTEAMQEIAVINGNEAMLESAKDQAFMNIAVKNFINGTHEQLREVLKANNTPESQQLIKKLDSMEFDFAKSKGYVNAEEVFLVKRTLDHNKNLLKIYEDKASSDTVTEGERKSYITAIASIKEKVNEGETELKEITSHSHQMKEIDSQVAKQQLIKVYENLPNIESITQLEHLVNKYPNSVAIAQRLNQVKEQKLISKGEPVKKLETKTVKKTETTETKEKTAKEPVVTEEEIKQEQYETVKKSNLKNRLDNYFQSKGQNVIPNESDYKALETVIKLKESSLSSNEEFDDLINNTSENIYKKYQEAEIVTDESTVIDEDTANQSKYSPDIIDDVNELANEMSKFEIMEDVQVSQPMTPEEKRASMMKQVELALNILDKLQAKGFKRDFNTFIKVLNDITPKITKLHYNRFVGVYMAATGEGAANIPSTYNEAFNIKITDLVKSEDGMITQSELNKVLEQSQEFFNPKVSDEDLHIIYLDENVTYQGATNPVGASSIAFKSQDSAFSKTSPSEVERITTSNKVDPNPILNPNKFNKGDEVQLSLNEELNDNTPITISSGIPTTWGELKANTIDTTAQKADIERRRQEELLGGFKIEDNRLAKNGSKPQTRIKVNSDGTKITFEGFYADKPDTGLNAAYPKMSLEEFRNSEFYKNLKPESREQLEEILTDHEDSVTGIGLKEIRISKSEGDFIGKGNSGITINILTKDGNINDIELASNTSKINTKYDEELKNVTEGRFNQAFYDKMKMGKMGFGDNLFDYYPIKFTTSVDGEVGTVHTTAWMNKFNSVPGTEKTNMDAIREFRKKIIPYLKANGNNPLTTKCLGKKIGITRDGKPKGFVLDTKDKKSASIAFPDTNLKLVQKRDFNENVLNKDEFDKFGSNLHYALMPVGKVNGKMQYWAMPLFNNKLSVGQAKTVRQAIEIFVKQDSSINQELYDENINNVTEKIDLTKSDDLKKYLSKVIYLYYGKEMPISDYIKAKNAINPESVIQIKGGVVTLGKSTAMTLDKNSDFEFIEKNIISSMLFNIDRDSTNKKDKFSFISLDNNNVVEKHDGTYNDFAKKSSTTFGSSTLLRDGSYGYTIQHITQFDMMIKELEQPIVEKQEATLKSTIGIKKPTLLQGSQEAADSIVRGALQNETEGTFGIRLKEYKDLIDKSNTSDSDKRLIYNSITRAEQEGIKFLKSEKQEGVELVKDETLEVKKLDIERRRQDDLTFASTQSGTKVRIKFGNPEHVGDYDYFKSIKKIINAKYDAELKSLESNVKEVKVDYFTDERVISALQKSNMTKDEFYTKYLSKVDEGKITLDRVLNALNKKDSSNKNSDKEIKCTD